MVLLQLRKFPWGMDLPKLSVPAHDSFHTEKEYIGAGRNSHHYRRPWDLSSWVFIHNQMKYQADRDALRLKLRSRWFILSTRPQGFPIGCVAMSATPLVIEKVTDVSDVTIYPLKSFPRFGLSRMSSKCFETM